MQISLQNCTAAACVVGSSSCLKASLCNQSQDLGQGKATWKLAKPQEHLAEVASARDLTGRPDPNRDTQPSVNLMYGMIVTVVSWV